MSDIHDELRDILTGQVCLVGVGNRLKGDDGAGPALIDRLAGQAHYHCLDAGTAPENYLEKIVRLKPDTVLLIDAMDFGGVPGAYRLFPAEQIADAGLSSHALSLRMTGDYLRQRISARIVVLGIQPVRVGLNAPLSAPVAATVDNLASGLLAASAHPEC